MTMLIDSHCHLDFPDFASELDDVVARARAAGIARMVTISTRVRPPRRRAGDRRTLSRRLSARSARIRITRTRNWTSRRLISSPARDIQRSSRSAKPGSTTTTTTPARRAGARFSHPHRGGARDRPAAGHPFARSRRRHGAHSRRGNRAGRLPGRAALLHRRRRPCPPRHRAWALHLVHRHPDLQELDGAARHRRRTAGRPHPGRDRRAVSRAAAVSRQAQRTGLCRRNRESFGRDARRFV